jgi:outer membrane protein assembly factor BamA
MNIRITSSLILILTALNVLHGQDFPKKPINQIIIVGNDHTDSEVIERELLFSRGEVVSDSILTESKNRILNLWLFNRVEFYPLPDGKNVNLLISVTERLYIFPYPEFRLEDRDWKKLTYGFGIAHENFRGRNEKVYLALLFGNRPGYQLSYFNPWVNRKLHLTTGFYLKKYSKESRETYLKDNTIQSFDENHFYMSLAFGRYWTRYFYNRIYLTRDQIRVGSQHKQVMQTGTTTDVDYGIFFQTVFDNRDLYAYPSAGWYTKFEIAKQGLFVPEINYWQYDIDIRKYISWKKLIFAGRISTLQSFGDLPIYDKVYFGYNERIRGHFSEIHSGKHIFVSSFEMRFPIIKPYYFDFLDSIFSGSATKDLRFGLNAGIFADTGIIWSRKNEFGTKNFISGFGAGIHILMPYIEVLRIDYAFDEDLQPETILEIQVAF